MASDGTKGGELVLAAGQSAFILDRTKGHVCVYVGPSKTSLSETDTPIRWDHSAQTYKPCNMQEAVSSFVGAPEGSYIVLDNPASDKQYEHPKENASNTLVPLDYGRKVNVRGPAYFALWYQQYAEVIAGHRLRSNQYLVVQVYNDEAARKNWNQAVIKRQPQTEKTDANPKDTADAPAAATTTEDSKPPENLSMGQRFIMKGTDLSFYIPPTGIAVVKDERDGSFVRDAVSLEQLEYCILLDEAGAKRFVRGPAVVFPSPTETFMEKGGSKKFKAIELNPNSGLYVKVIAPYEEGGKKYGAGEELFITGKDQAIYYPRPEHAIIKYGEQAINFAVAVTSGEGRYVLNRDTGVVTMVRGPAMLLPDPRTEVIVRRALEKKQVELWYPGNTRAIQVNEQLLEEARNTDPSTMRLAASMVPSLTRSMRSEVSYDALLAGEEFGRKSSFTPPRTVTLDNKYDGAVEVSPWTGYAVLVVGKTGDREVIQGPATRLLEFDEILMPTELSTGTPKNSEKTIKTAYLRVKNNRVSDIVEAETSDLVNVRVRLSYRVNFEGDPMIWFNVENYIQFMCDHTRSLIRNMVKKLGIQEFHKGAIDLIRDSILGKAEADKGRPGRVFKENGMRIYDVEVLDIVIGNDAISQLMVGAQHETVKAALAIAKAQQDLQTAAKQQEVAKVKQQMEAEINLLKLELQAQAVARETALALARLEKENQVQLISKQAEKALQEIYDSISTSELARQKATDEQGLATLQQQQDLKFKAEMTAAEALKIKAAAFSPDLIAALQAFGDKDLACRVAEAMSPLAILREQSVATSFIEMTKGTGLENVVQQFLTRLTPKPS